MAKDKTVLKLLRTARGLVAKGWIQDALAEDKQGHEVSVRSDKAVNFCAVGALRRAEFKLGTRGVATRARAALRNVLPRGRGSVMYFNDTHNKKSVLELFDTAISKVK